MAQFVMTSSRKRWLNLEHVRSVTRRDSDGAFDCWGENGEQVGTLWESPEAGAIVPNTVGTMLVSFFPDGSFDRQPVVAWRVTGSTAEPVISEDHMPEGYCLEDPGKWLFPFDAGFSTWEAAREHGLELARERQREIDARANRP